MPTAHHRRFRTVIRFGIVLAWMLASEICQRSLADDPRSDDTAPSGRRLNDEERLQTLDMLAEKLRENYEKIRTWKGEFHFFVPVEDFHFDQTRVPQKAEK